MTAEELEKENAELRKVAEFQQSSNMDRFFEIKKLKEGLEVGSLLNRGLIAQTKYLEEDRDKYRNMVFDKIKQLDKAKEIIKLMLPYMPKENIEGICEIVTSAEYFIKEVEA